MIRYRVLISNNLYNMTSNTIYEGSDKQYAVKNWLGRMAGVGSFIAGTDLKVKAGRRGENKVQGGKGEEGLEDGGGWIQEVMIGLGKMISKRMQNQ